MGWPIRPEGHHAVAIDRRSGDRRRGRRRDRARAVPARLAHLDFRSAALRVIDVSGAVANNAGLLVLPMRDEVLAANITINGLPIMLKRPFVGTMDIENLDIYYEDCVIGGPGAFVVPIHNTSQFIDATRTKLILEVAGRQPD